MSEERFMLAKIRAAYYSKLVTARLVNGGKHFLKFCRKYQFRAAGLDFGYDMEFMEAQE